jgi:hypothetical protein
LAFHIGLEVDCYLDGHMAELSWQTGAGDWRAVMRLPEGLKWDAVRGRTQPPLGWYAPCFGAKLPIVTLVGAGTIAAGDRMVTDIRINFSARRTAAAGPDQSVAATASP